MKEIKTDDIKAIKKLESGELVLLSGTLYTARDKSLKRMSEEKKDLKFLSNAIIFHAGPTEKNEKGKFSCGPTTSKRMDCHLTMLFKKNIVATVGKGERDIAIHKKSGKIYFIALGGLGSLYGERIKSLKPFLYKELKAEAIYKIEVKDFPVIVAIDGKGKSIFNRR